MYNHILVPLDQSPVSQKAIEYAIESLNPVDGVLTLLTVVDAPTARAYFLVDYPIAADTELFNQIMEKNRSDAFEYLTGLSRRNIPGYLKTDVLVETGEPATIILDTIKKLGIDLVVMATHGRSGLNRLVMGSVTQEVLQHAQVPVVVIPKAISLQAAVTEPETEALATL